MTKTERRPKGASFILSVSGMFDLAAPDRRRFEGEQALWMMVGKELPQNRVFDIGLPKPQAEVLVAGHAAAPGGVAVPRMGLSWTFGGRSKSLLVTGDRFWRMDEGTAVATEPRPFVQMPLTPARCYGGAGHAVNPEGTGFRVQERLLAQETVALPNIEIPESAIRSIGDTPPTAFFWPMAVDAPERMRYAGTYDTQWLKTRAPALPDDVDPRLFLFAPEDQRLPGYLEGNEEYHLRNFAADAPEIRTTLPHFRVRCFVGWVDPEKPVTEVSLRIDTLWLFAGARRGILIYRGALPVEDIEAEDVADTLYVYERGEDAPLPAEHYLRIREQRLDRENGHKFAFAEHQIAPPYSAEEIEAREARRRELAAASKAERAKNSAWVRRKMLEESGVPQDLWPEAGPEPEGLDIPTLLPEELESGEFDLAAILDAMEAASEKGKADMEKTLAEHKARMDAQEGESAADSEPESLDALFASMGEPDLGKEIDAALAQIPDIASLIPEGVEPPAGLPDLDQLRDWRSAFEAPSPAPPPPEDDQLELARARFLDLPEGRPLAHLRRDVDEDLFDFPDFPDLDNLPDFDLPADWTPPEQQEDLSFDRIIGLLADNPHVPKDTVDKISHEFAGIDDTLRKSFPDLDAPPGKALEALIAKEMPADDRPRPKDPKEAIEMAKAELAKAKAEFAEMPRPTRPDLDDTEAKLIESMKEMRLQSPHPSYPQEPLTPSVARAFGELIVAEAKSGLSWAGRDCAGADLRGFDLSGMDLSGALMEQTRLDGACLAGARMVKTVLSGASLVGTDLSGCDLTEANLCKADARKARFVGAKLVKTQIFETGFTGAVFDDAEIENWTAIQMAFDGASFQRVRMKSGTFMRCTLAESDWSGARVDRGSFMDVDCPGLKAVGATMFEVGFMQVRAAGVDFSDSHLDSVSFAGEADLQGARFDRATTKRMHFQAADLTGSSFERARLDRSCFVKANLSRSNFRAASLRGALLSRNDLGSTDFAVANLFEAQLNKADLRGAQLRSANLFGADLADAKLAGADLTDANLGRTVLEIPTDA